MKNSEIKNWAGSITLVLALLAFTSTCIGTPKPLEVFVSILPQKYFVEKIAGEHAHVEVMVGPGQSPETYEPSPKQLVKLASADIYFSIDVPFEALWMSHIEGVNEQISIVDTASEALKLYDQPQDEDPHIWVSPILAQKISEQILAGLIESDPDNTTVYQANFQLLESDLKALDQEIRQILSDWIGKGSFLVMHPAWGAFATTYKLEQMAIEHEGKSPSARSLQTLINTAIAKKVQVVFIQDQHSSRMANTVASAIGAEVVKLDPLAENYIENMRKVAKEIVGSFK